MAIEGTQLQYAKNTTGNLLKSLGDQKTYVLVSGRWFRSASAEGPWEYVANDGLPADFAKIPDDSPKENVKAAVAGTPQAKEALIANAIPQTAAVKVSEAKIDPPRFDGDAKLAPIEGTSMQYVVNTATPIIQLNATSYYAVQDGVWFTSTATSGPWTVATSVPSVIYSDPAQLAGPLRHVRAHLRFDPGLGLRGLHAGLLRNLRVERHGGLRHRLLLPALRGADRLVRASGDLRRRRRDHVHAVDGMDLRLRLRVELGCRDRGLGLGSLSVVGPRRLGLLLPVSVLSPGVLGRRRLGTLGRRRGLGARRLGGHDRQRLFALGLDLGGDTTLGRLQRLDRERLAQFRRDVLQLAHRKPRRRPAIGRRQRLHAATTPTAAEGPSPTRARGRPSAADA